MKINSGNVYAIECCGRGDGRNRWLTCRRGKVVLGDNPQTFDAHWEIVLGQPNPAGLRCKSPSVWLLANPAARVPGLGAPGQTPPDDGTACWRIVPSDEADIGSKLREEIARREKDPLAKTQLDPNQTYVQFQAQAIRSGANWLNGRTETDDGSDSVTFVEENTADSGRWWRLVPMLSDSPVYADAFDDFKQKMELEQKGLRSELADIKKLLSTDLQPKIQEAERAHERLQAAERALKEELSTREAVEHWERFAADRRVEASFWTKWFYGGCVVAVVAIVVCAWMLIDTGQKDITPGTIRQSLIVVTVIAVMGWILRSFLRVALSNRHSRADALERAALTRAYIALIKHDSPAVPEGTRQAVIGALFSRSVTGLIREEGEKNSSLIQVVNELAKPGPQSGS